MVEEEIFPKEFKTRIQPTCANPKCHRLLDNGEVCFRDLNDQNVYCNLICAAHAPGCYQPVTLFFNTRIPDNHEIP